MKGNFKKIIGFGILLIIINIISSFIFKRFDLTHDNRYTLSSTTLNVLKNAKEPLYIDVFLEGNFPAEFKKLQSETRQLLEELKAYNSNIIFQFINPLENPDEAEAVMQQFYERGLTPMRITVDEKGKQSQEVVYPWAIATYKNKSTKISLLKNKMKASTEEKIIHSVQHLEYAFTNGFHTITTPKKKKIAIIKGKNELPDLFKADFLQTIKDNYFIAPFPLDSVKSNAPLIQQALKTFDLAIITKPKTAFTDQEKQVLDQFIIHGGKTIWLIDAVNVSMEDLNKTGNTLAFATDLGLNDMFFKYGFRINPTLIKDLECTPIALATGKQGSETQYQNYPWFFSPLIVPNSKHPIVNNIDVIKLEFTNPIDTLKNNIKKTILLHSSPYSKSLGTPTEISLDMIEEQPDEKTYNPGNFPVALLLEGKFHSVFENRVLPTPDKNFKNTYKNTKMIVVSDGDIIKNQLDQQGQPLELGFDKWTNQLYANKEFLLNSVNYLLDDTGLINIRTKEVNLPLLNKQKVYEQYTLTQTITVILPLLILALLYLLITYIRKRKYAN